jgi:hypothetical protein
MREHLKIMTEFLEQNNQAHDAQDKQFIKTLCEDMNISLKTIGTTNQQSYINARSTSQGRQQMYNVNINNGPLDPTDPINNVYATPTAMKLMRDFSQR